MRVYKEVHGPNLKFCFIKRSHCRTVLEGLWSQPGARSNPRREFVIFATLCERKAIKKIANLADVATFYDCSLKNVQTNNGTYGLKEPEIGLECTLSLMFGHISHCALLYLFFQVTSRTLPAKWVKIRNVVKIL